MSEFKLKVDATKIFSDFSCQDCKTKHILWFANIKIKSAKTESIFWGDYFCVHFETIVQFIIFTQQH